MGNAFSTFARLLRCSFALALLVIVGVFAASASAFSPSEYSAVSSSCGVAPPGAAACQGLRLVPRKRHIGGHKAKISQAKQADEVIVSPGGLNPQALHEAYALPYSVPGVSATQTVALIDAYDDPNAEADLAVYDAQYGLPACTTANGCFRKVDQNGGVNYPPPGDWSEEVSTDVQMVHAICGDCHVLLVEAKTDYFNDFAAAVKTAVSLGATEVSNSYAGGEWGDESSAYNYPGVVITASSGDCGYLNETPGECAPPGQTSYPASSPYVVAVGGTSLSKIGDTWQSSLWTDGGSGCSIFYSAPSWQSTAAGFASTGCGNKRSAVDVSAVADPFNGVSVYDSAPGKKSGPPGWTVMGGTSVAAPIIAAEYALAGGSHSVAYPASTLYNHLGSASLTDIVSGFNGPCPTSLCKALPGFDGASGVGSPLGLGAFSATGTPTNTGAPQIVEAEGKRTPLGAQPGTWTGSPALAYQWQVGGAEGFSDIPGATSPNYCPSGIASGQQVRVEVLASNSLGASAADSEPTEPSTSANGSASSLCGYAIVGQKLTAALPHGSGALPWSYSYAWQRSERGSYKNIPGATAATYTLHGADRGHRVRAIVTVSDTTATTSYASAPSAVVVSPGRITALTVAPHALSAPAPGAASDNANRHRHLGALVNYRDTQGGPVTLEVLYAQKATRVGAHGCKYPPGGAALVLKVRARCIVYQALSHASTVARRGLNHWRFNGLVGSTTLRRGAYVLAAQPLGSSEVSTSFFSVR